VEKYGRVRRATDDNKRRSMRMACWINKATDTHPEHAVLSCTATMITRMQLNVTLLAFSLL
jgi:hypothetical protein